MLLGSIHEILVELFPLVQLVFTFNKRLRVIK